MTWECFINIWITGVVCIVVGYLLGYSVGYSKGKKYHGYL